MHESIAIAAGLVLLSFSVAALAGFGATVIAVTLGAHFLPIDWWVPRVVSLNIFLMAYLVIRHRGHADFGLLLKRILPLMGTGMLAGLAVAQFLSGPTLEAALGIFVVLMSARELLSALKVLPRPTRPIPGPVGSGLIAIAGMIHGIYASGGPLLVYAVSRSGLTKSKFRSTLAVVWLTLNSTLLGAFILQGRFTSQAAQQMLPILPVVVVATALGEWGHKRIDEARFKVVVYSILLFAGGALLAR